MNGERTFAAFAALVLTVAGFQQLMMVPPAYASVVAARIA